MKLNVAQLIKSPVGTVREYDLEETFPQIEGQRLLRPVRMYLHLTRINEGLLARGDVETMLATTCSRCVEPAEQPIKFHFEEEFRPTIDVLSGQPLKPLDDDEPVFHIDSNHVIDLEEVVRQGIVLETPMHPLCRATCRGLCPSCGRDLNREECTCPPEPPAGSLAAVLKDLAPLFEPE